MEQVKLEPLTSRELSIVTWVEQYWHKNSRFPYLKEFKQKLGQLNFPQDFPVTDLMEKPSFKRAMDNRGISIPSVTDVPVDLNNDQLAGILAVTNYLDKRSQSVKLKSLGITTSQWNGWLKNKIFKEYLHEVSSNTFKDSIHIAQESLVSKLESGDTSAIKLYMELTGRYQEGGSQVANLRLILTKLVEVLRRRITDENLLRAIGQDFDLILSGQEPVPVAPPRIDIPAQQLLQPDSI